jgi:hypothetical protein
MTRIGTENNRTLLNRFRHVVDHGWYITSREGVLGPYLVRQEAVTVLDQHKKVQLYNESRDG